MSAVEDPVMKKRKREKRDFDRNFKTAIENTLEKEMKKNNTGKCREELITSITTEITSVSQVLETLYEVVTHIVFRP